MEVRFSKECRIILKHEIDVKLKLLYTIDMHEIIGGYFVDL